jgi:hypothetical protein
MFQTTDGGGNVWFNQAKEEEHLNHGYRGAHVVIPFQCESCWLVNLERRLPIQGLDDVYVSLIRRANLDAMAGRARSTVAGHVTALRRTVQNCHFIGKTPTIEPRGPMPLADLVGMGVAVNMLVYSLTAKPRISGQRFIQYSTVRKVRATHTCVWESSPRGIEEGSSFSQGFGKATLTSCPTQQKWFSLFSLGIEARMGYSTRANKALLIKTVVHLLEMVKEEAEDAPASVRDELYKFGAAVVVAQCGSLRGQEVLTMDLAGMRAHIALGREGVLPADPMRVGQDLSNAPHIFFALLGKFKGENGIRQHMICVASTTVSGIEMRWRVERLIEVREREGWTEGPAFGYKDGSVYSLRELDGLLHYFLEKIQKEDETLLAGVDNVSENYGFFWTFRKTAEGRARAANLESDVQNSMNRWRKVESARGRMPRFSMVDHYTNARDLMRVTWRYSYVQ